MKIFGFEFKTESGKRMEGHTYAADFEEVVNLIGDQKLINFMSLSTVRMFFAYKNGVLFIDKSEYLGICDYELEYEAKSYHAGKQEFISIISELGIKYKRSEKKVKRAFNAYKMLN